MQKISIGLLCGLVAVSCVHGMENETQRVVLSNTLSEEEGVEYFSGYTPFLKTINNMLEDLGGNSDEPIPIQNINTESFGDTITLLPHFLYEDPLLALTDPLANPLKVSTQLNYVQRRKIRAVLEPLSLQRLHALVIAVNYLDAPAIMLDTVLEEYAERLKNMSVEEYAKVLKTISNDLPTELVKRMRDIVFIKPIIQCLQGLPSIIKTTDQKKPVLCPILQEWTYILAGDFNKNKNLFALTIGVGSAGIATGRSTGWSEIQANRVPFIVDLSQDTIKDLRESELHTDAISHMIFSNDGTMLASIGTEDPRLIVYRLSGGSPYIIQRDDQKRSHPCAAFSNDNQRIVVGYKNGSVEIHDLKKNRKTVDVIATDDLLKVATDGLLKYVVFHPTDNSMAAFVGEKFIGVLLPKIDEETNTIMPDTYAPKILQMTDVLSEGHSIENMWARGVAFTQDGKWIIGAYERILLDNEKKFVRQIVCARWPVTDLNASGELATVDLDVKHMTFPLNASLIQIVAISTDMLQQKCVMQVLCEGELENSMQSFSRLCVVDFKNKNSMVFRQNNGILVGQGAIVAYCERKHINYEKSNEPVLADIYKLCSLCGDKVFDVVTTPFGSPFVFLNKDATKLILSADHGKLATFTLYNDSWRRFFSHLERCQLPLQELHRLYILCMNMNTSCDLSLDAVYTQLSTIPGIQKEIKSCFGIGTVTKKTEEVPVPKQESGGFAKIRAAQHYVRTKASRFVKEVQKQVVPRQPQQLFETGFGGQPEAGGEGIREELKKKEPGLLVWLVALPFRFLRFIWKAVTGS
jgi:S-phase kinase-associated protein 1